MLHKFKFKIPPILEPGFIGECGSERRIKFGDAPSIPYVIVPKAGDAKRVAGLGLDAGRRSPTHAVDFKRGMVLQVNLPINLGKERSEERRVGKEGRSRCGAYHDK